MVLNVIVLMTFVCRAVVEVTSVWTLPYSSYCENTVRRETLKIRSAEYRVVSISDGEKYLSRRDGVT